MSEQTWRSGQGVCTGPPAPGEHGCKLCGCCGDDLSPHRETEHGGLCLPSTPASVLPRPCPCWAALVRPSPSAASGRSVSVCSLRRQRLRRKMPQVLLVLRLQLLHGRMQFSLSGRVVNAGASCEGAQHRVAGIRPGASTQAPEGAELLEARDQPPSTYFLSSPANVCAGASCIRTPPHALGRGRTVLGFRSGNRGTEWFKPSGRLPLRTPGQLDT
ncbi:uncharacterized protein LOC106005695 [Mustela putorius furo]|uniref:Uncharacterized protein LOC106005695 n=1 Tax=Mustela putorius furo TaxID=9669 RepID=A0A8U0NRJ5_MUSPF|nr:uncharacterized protein LOC106005695 [Mustela putorius furo]